MANQRRVFIIIVIYRRKSCGTTGTADKAELSLHLFVIAEAVAMQVLPIFIFSGLLPVKEWIGRKNCGFASGSRD